MNRIKEIRLQKKVSQKDLAESIDITRQAISLYEKNLRTPSPKVWQALADYFNVSVPYLQGATTYEVLDSAERDIYNYVIKAMDRAFNDCALLPVQQERILKAIAYSIDNGEFN
ncbi:MAG: helix-turn-helix domain-containing protein [Lactobacillus johnsonii]|nr:helix-turn-helix domain-containing protein [Lactobacillus johnsonii]MDY2640410.1 helix-turn-helix transcriptional regulator [Ligilactobacillus salivarius]